MNKVFVVCRLDWDDFNVCAVFASQPDAEEFIARARKLMPGFAWWVCERELRTSIADALFDAAESAWTFESFPR